MDRERCYLSRWPWAPYRGSSCAVLIDGGVYNRRLSKKDKLKQFIVGLDEYIPPGTMEPGIRNWDLESKREWASDKGSKKSPQGKVQRNSCVFPP